MEHNSCDYFFYNRCDCLRECTSWESLSDRTNPYSTVVLYVYMDHRDLGFLAKYHPQNQLNIYFVTSMQDWLGIAKPKNVFRSTINP